MLRATWYEGTAQLLSLAELKLHLFELYFNGWTIKPVRRCEWWWLHIEEGEEVEDDKEEDKKPDLGT